MLFWTKWIIHSCISILGLVCLWKGLWLWSKKEDERIAFENSRRKRMEQEIEINQRRLEETDLANKIVKLNSEKESLKESSKKEIEKKDKQIEELGKEILEKKKEIIEAKAKLYDLKKEEISKFPTNFLTNGFNSSVSGAAIIPSPVDYSSLVSNNQNSSPLFLNSSLDQNITNVKPNYQKKCKSCGNIYPLYAVMCSNCNSLLD